MAASFLQFCATCEKQINIPSNSVLYCSESCRRRDTVPSSTSSLSQIPSYQSSSSPTSFTNLAGSPPIAPLDAISRKFSYLSAEDQANEDDDGTPSRSVPDSEAARYLRQFQDKHATRTCANAVPSLSQTPTSTSTSTSNSASSSITNVLAFFLSSSSSVTNTTATRASPSYRSYFSHSGVRSSKPASAFPSACRKSTSACPIASAARSGPPPATLLTYEKIPPRPGGAHLSGIAQENFVSRCLSGSSCDDKLACRQQPSGAGSEMK